MLCGPLLGVIALVGVGIMVGLGIWAIASAIALTND